MQERTALAEVCVRFIACNIYCCDSGITLRQPQQINKMYTVTDLENTWGVYLNLGFQKGAFKRETTLFS